MSATTATRRRHGPLLPAELAAGSVLAGVTAVLTVVATLIPVAGALQALATVPMGLLARRHRLRALVTGTVAATLIAFVATGTGGAIGVLSSAFLGGLVGGVKRRGRGRLTAFCCAAVVAPLFAALVDGLLLLFGQTRTLILQSAANTVKGLAKTIARIPGLTGVGARVDEATAWALDYWWLWIGALVILSVLGGTWLAWLVLGAVLDRLTWISAPDPLPMSTPSANHAPPEPLPVRLHDVCFRYPGADTDALTDVDLSIRAGEFIAVVGANGSGKSTLVKILAGREPTRGVVDRPGAPGLGRVGGTAIVLQRPETQVLGVRVADDVVWGLPADTAVDVDGLLDAVGLGGMGERSTADLSGGQLQRLAVAGALARRPALLLADEPTAMIDPGGRRELVDLLAQLPTSRGVAVVLVTHYEADAAGADRVIHLERGRVTDRPRPEPLRVPPSVPVRVGKPIVEIVGVSHTYASGTPWSSEALRDIRLSIRAGEGVLISGGNGSGKSTLAWIIAGLLRPSGGSCLVDGCPATDRVGTASLAFQHARLQLQRPTVAADIAAAAGFPPRRRDRVNSALARVGLDPAFADRPIDRLSGGEMRKVVLAGLLESKPRVLVLDEPLAGLDPGTRQDLIGLLAGLRRSEGLTVVLISHDVEGVEAVCDRTVVLEGGMLAASAVRSGR